jgi:hypothetical protein
VVASEPGDAYTAETALRTVADVLQEQGRPDGITLDRDPRCERSEGSWTAKDFPSPMLRFLECLEIRPDVCPPQKPEKNPYVERYHRNYKYECQERQQPQNLESTIATNTSYVQFYNYERPNHRSCREHDGARRQAITCGNQPPLVKFPDPPQLSPVPETVDPDRWVLALTGKIFKRRLNPNGSFQLGNQTYYVSKKLHGHYATIQVDGQGRELTVSVNRQPVKQLAMKGLQNRMMAFAEFVDWMAKEAESAWRRYLRRTPTYARGAM